MKMAKASEADIKMALDLSSLLGSLERGDMPQNADGGEYSDFDPDDGNDCIEAVRRILDIMDRGSLGRVVLGMATLLNPLNELVDPDDNCLSLHPNHVKNEEDAARYRFIRRKFCLIGNGDGTCAMQAINLPVCIPGWPDTGKTMEFCDAAIDVAAGVNHE